MNICASDRLERLPLCSYHRFLLLIIGLAFFFDNLDLAMMTYLLGSIKAEFGLTTAEAGMLGSASFVGMAIGAVCSGLFADRFGRKPLFQMSMIVWGVGSYLCSTATDPLTLGVYRFILGIGMGMELPLAQTLLSEFIPAKRRGKYLALMDGNWPIAFICAGLISYMVLPSYGWRTMFEIGAVPALFLFAIRRFVPESPRWLESRGRAAEASAIVDGIEGTVKKRLKLTVLPPVIARTAGSAPASIGLRDLWSGVYRPRLLTACALWFFALLGFYGLSTWLGALLQQSGYDVTKSVLYTVYISTGGIPGFLWAAWAVERWGRKPTCIITLLGGALAVMTYGYVALGNLGIPALFASGFSMQFFLFGMWAVLYTYTPELFPTGARASGCGLSSTAGRMGSLIGPTTVGIILPVAGTTGVFGLGAACFVMAALVIYKFGIETRGMSLEEIATHTEEMNVEPALAGSRQQST
ncbi:MFS transporter [Azospirillum sp. CT11-132]|jgi:putative MFS transporter|uniref:MFS transporter n=1 Tax=unclassified Azospirillum TaxID=2630922 RepID=UPI000D60AD92|nr:MULTISPECIES: MFS transporter [unclassified Azospirillum]PWC52731.1 MFS transporter [Azospirillum sp. TSH7]PWC55289.1 MFS transporter [Azospirillum sp. TSH20]